MVNQKCIILFIHDPPPIVQVISPWHISVFERVALHIHASVVAFFILVLKHYANAAKWPIVLQPKDLGELCGSRVVIIVISVAQYVIPRRADAQGFQCSLWVPVHYIVSAANPIHFAPSFALIVVYSR